MEEIELKYRLFFNLHLQMGWINDVGPQNNKRSKYLPTEPVALLQSFFNLFTLFPFRTPTMLATLYLRGMVTGGNSVAYLETAVCFW